ncbi:MAG: Ig-like domain-containing protein [Salinibacter sp.]
MVTSERLRYGGRAIGIGLLLALVPCDAADAASAREVVINELAWMGTAASSYDEWIELHNPTDSAIDLAGWTLGSDDGSPDIELTGTIPSGGYYVLERTDDEAVSDVAADQIYTGTLSNSGEALTLRDGSDNVIDRANRDSGNWPGGVNPSDDPDGWGTMERVDPSAPDDADNWATNDGTARNGLDAVGDPIHGTPGEANSVAELNAAPACQDVAADVAEDDTVSIDPNCSDPDGDSLSYAIVEAPSRGSANVSNGQLEYEPDADFNGSDAFTYRANDGQAHSNTASVDVTVTPVNDAPTCEAISVEVDEGNVAQITPNCSDVDGDSLSYEIVEAPSHGTASVNAGKLRYQPAAGFSGADSFTYRADDGVATSTASVTAAATSRDATVSVTVASDNDPPSASNDTATTQEDTAVTIDVLSNDSDPDGDPLTVDGVTSPDHGTASVTADDTITYDPTPNFHGSDSFSYTIRDDDGATDTATVDVTVEAVNDAPTCHDVSLETDEDNANSVAPDCSDPDGDRLNYEIVEAPSHGSASVDTGSLHYQPDADFNGSDTFTYRADDGQADSQAATVDVTVNPVNDPPSCNAISVEIEEGAAAQVTPDCTDPDGDSLSYEIVDAPSHGAASVTAGKLRYRPAEDFTGSDSFTYHADDGADGSRARAAALSNVATVTITVTATNDAPECRNISSTTNEDQTVEFAPDCSDPDGDSLSYEVRQQPDHGTVEVADDRFRYQPDPDFHGEDAFTYRASDGAATSNEATAQLTIQSVNDAPTCRPLTVGIDEDTTTRIDPDCQDPEGDALTYAIASSPDHGTASIDEGRIHYAPDADFHGEDVFTYRADDGNRRSGPAEVSVTVAPVNDPPVARDQSVSTDEDTPVEVTLDAADVDGDELDFQVETPPKHGSLSGEPPALTYAPQSGFAGTDEFTFTASDGQAVSDPATVRVDVEAVADGNVDGDNAVDAIDARICLQLARGLLEGDDVPRSVAVCDVDGDGDVDRDDAERIARRALNKGSDASPASRSPRVENWAGLGLLALGLSLILSHRGIRRTRFGLISVLLLGAASLLTGCPGLIPGLPADATGIQASVHPDEIRLEVQNMPNGGLAALQVRADGLRFDADALDVTGVRPAANWLVLATEIDNDAGRVRVVAVRPRGGTSAGDVVSLRIDPKSGFGRGAADVRWAPAHLTLGDADNAEIMDFQTGTQP